MALEIYTYLKKYVWNNLVNFERIRHSRNMIYCNHPKLIDIYRARVFVLRLRILCTSELSIANFNAGALQNRQRLVELLAHHGAFFSRAFWTKFNITNVAAGKSRLVAALLVDQLCAHEHAKLRRRPRLLKARYKFGIARTQIHRKCVQNKREGGKGEGKGRVRKGRSAFARVYDCDNAKHNIAENFIGRSAERRHAWKTVRKIIMRCRWRTRVDLVGGRCRTGAE